MKKQRVDDIIKEVAQMNHTTPENVRRQMEDAIEQAQKSTDPTAQAYWLPCPARVNNLHWRNLSPMFLLFWILVYKA